MEVADITELEQAVLEHKGEESRAFFAFRFAKGEIKHIAMTETVDMTGHLKRLRELRDVWRECQANLEKAEAELLASRSMAFRLNVLNEINAIKL